MRILGNPFLKGFTTRIEAHINRIETCNLSKSAKLFIRLIIGLVPAFLGSILAFIPTSLTVFISIFLLYLSARPVQSTLFTFDPDEKFWKVSIPVNALFIAWGVLLAIIGMEIEISRSVGPMVVLSTTAIWPVYMSQAAYRRRKPMVTFEQAYTVAGVIVSVQQFLIIGGGIMKRFAVLTIICFMAMSVPAHAFDPMRIPVGTALPTGIKTVGKAAQYYADAIGYRLLTDNPAPAESAGIAGEGLSPLSKIDSIMPVEEAILAILRTEYVLVIDHNHKIFSFENVEVSQ
ncbi:hypothetical protein [Desulfosarcina cetonica]|uniref:hypothetical protein n=1 Tax=Desulfosarcina cetonica TaxID=90730 RepID=UPI0006D18D39|nr:hypothetical protein [Desulfosarcina cetonica]